MYYLCSENKGANQLICAFVFAYAGSRFSYDMAHLKVNFASIEAGNMHGIRLYDSSRLLNAFPSYWIGLTQLTTK